VCQMIAYDETLITTNFQVEPIIGLRDVRDQSSKSVSPYVLKHELLYLSNNSKFHI